MTVVRTVATVSPSKKRWIDAVTRTQPQEHSSDAQCVLATALLIVVRGQCRAEQGNVVNSNHSRAGAYRLERHPNGRLVELGVGRIREPEQRVQESLAARPDHDRRAEHAHEVP